MTRSANAKARVAQLTAFPSSFAPAGRAVVEGLALPFLKAPLLRWGPSCAVGYGGRPSVPPLRRFAGRRNRRIRKAMPYKRSPLQSGRVRTPAPTADVKAFLFFRRGRTLAGPLKGFCHSGPTLIRLAYARHLLPSREKARAADSRPYGIFSASQSGASRRPRPTAQHQPPPARQSQARKWNRASFNF